MQVAFGKLPIKMSVGNPVNGIVAVAYVYWFVPASIGDQFVLDDGSGNLVLPGNCEVAGQSQWFNFSGRPVQCNGLALARNDSGTLYVYPA